MVFSLHHVSSLGVTRGQPISSLGETIVRGCTICLHLGHKGLHVGHTDNFSRCWWRKALTWSSTISHGFPRLCFRSYQSTWSLSQTSTTCILGHGRIYIRSGLVMPYISMEDGIQEVIKHWPADWHSPSDVVAGTNKGVGSSAVKKKKGVEK